MREEQLINTQNIMEQAHVACNAVSVAYAAHDKGKGKGWNMSTTQYNSCKKHGHIAPPCLQKFCNYCKQSRHINKECPSCPPRSNKAYHDVVTPGALQPAITAVTTAASVDLQPATPPLTQESGQEMIVHAFSALGFQGTGSLSTSWIVDSGTSNHMTNSSHGLSNIKEYCGTSCIQTAKGSDLPIAAVGDVFLPLRMFLYLLISL